MRQETERRIAEIHRGHDCETWNLLLEDSAQAAVNATIYREYTLRHGTVQTTPGGHQFYADAQGKVDNFHMEGDLHNGPGCAVCEEAWCSGCSPEIYQERCPG